MLPSQFNYVGNPSFSNNPVVQNVPRLVKLTNTFDQYLLVKLVTNVPVH